MSINQSNNIDDDDPISMEANDDISNAPVFAQNQTSDDRISMEVNDDTPDDPVFAQNQTLEQVRRRTFSHWPHSSLEFIDRMKQAGFFGCNLGDHAICIHCGLICQQWIPNNDDPCEIHRAISPNCPYVRLRLINYQPPPPLVINTGLSPTVNVTHSPTNVSSPINLTEYDIVAKLSFNSQYYELTKRVESFNNWSYTNSPSVDDLVRAGFFYTGMGDIVTCFYCNGSLRNWNSNNDPAREHLQRFPHCAYARQLSNKNNVYRNGVGSQRSQQVQLLINSGVERNHNSGSTMNILAINRLAALPNTDNTIKCLVAARLDLPISQRSTRIFGVSIVRQCWEDQLRIKDEDFVSEFDLYMACRILQKTNQCINGNSPGNIVIPSVRMRQLELQRLPDVIRSITTRLRMIQSTATGTQAQDLPRNLTPSNLCVLCLTEEKRLAYLPCGHLATCVPCGHTLRSCPICRCKIDAFMRIYI
ncbi:unnamed protein product [Adineta steineri]|uniref:RING-type domain-containing protein n=1 Tax=Adineta steineri TaxID=433720 RepID=A0A813Y8P8_9BILA|nr:unnamed protein product [Adineta steineri]CAF3494249.1 unnamed protein product [Adineta steineri]